MIQAGFREWNLDKLDAAFGIQQVFESALLKEWEEMPIEIKSYEEAHLLKLQRWLKLGGDEWNETELENKFISPLIMLADIENAEFSYFLERNLKATIQNYELSGNVDGVIATGFRSPRVPFFCMHEYKKAMDYSGNPNAQVLIAMLVAQAINENKKPIYGLFIVGSIWQFVLLEGKSYCFSQKYDTSKHEVLDVFRMMRGLRTIIETRLLD